MGIDIYARWKNQTKEEEQAQFTGYSTVAGNVGYLREAYHGGPYVTKYLLQEAFASPNHECPIKAEILRERLPRAVALAIHRNAKLYSGEDDPATSSFEDIKGKLDKVFSVEMKDDSAIEIAGTLDEGTVSHMKTLIEGKLLPDYAQSFVDFVELCERKEKELGEPVLIDVSA